MESKTAPGVGDPTVWNATVCALQKALILETQRDKFGEVTAQLQKLAEKTFRFTMPIYPQKAALHLFVERSMNDFPEFFGSCQEDIALLHHLQRYGACYVAYKAGYFSAEVGGNTSTKSLPRIRLLLPKLKPQTETIVSEPNAGNSQSESTGVFDSGRAVIEKFLAGCHPPMLHLFDGFQRARITGEIHLQSMARWTVEELRKYVMSSEITQTELEVEAIVEAFVRKKASQM